MTNEWTRVAAAFIHSFITEIYIAPLQGYYSEALPTLARLKRRVLSKMCQKESWGAISATKEAHSTQRGQPPRMHGPGLWRYEQKEERVTPLLNVM